MRVPAVDALLAITVVVCAAGLLALAAMATETRANPPPRPTAEEVARLIAQKEAAREHAAVLRRFDALAATAGVALGASTAALAVRLAGRPRPATRLVAIGSVIAIGGPLLTWAAYWALGGRTPPPPVEIAFLPLIGVALAALGSLWTGTALRPAGSPLRGLAMGAVVYTAAGFTSLFAMNALRENIVAGLPAILADPVAFYVLVLLWPLRVAAQLGLFGLTFGS